MTQRGLWPEKPLKCLEKGDWGKRMFCGGMLERKWGFDCIELKRVGKFLRVEGIFEESKSENNEWIISELHRWFFVFMKTKNIIWCHHLFTLVSCELRVKKVSSQQIRIDHHWQIANNIKVTIFSYELVKNSRFSFFTTQYCHLQNNFLVHFPTARNRYSTKLCWTSQKPRIFTCFTLNSNTFNAARCKVS